MKEKKCMALFTAMMLAVLPAGCGNSEAPVQEATGGQEILNETQSSIDGASETNLQADVPDNKDGTEYNVTWEDMAEIVVVYPSMDTLPGGLSAVEDAINAITEEEINTHVTLNMIEVGNYEQQINLMISSNTQIDLLVTRPGGPLSLSTMISQGQLMDITELSQVYAPKSLEVVGELIKGTQVDGTTYAIPAYKSYVTGIFINMRTDVLEDLGLVEQAQNMTCLSDYEAILEAVKNSEEWKQLAGIATGSNGGVFTNGTNIGYAENFSDCTFYDNLGNTQFVVSVPQDGDSTVAGTFSSDWYKQNYELAKRLWDKGYVYKDAITNQEVPAALIKSNAAFSYISATEIGSESSVSRSCGMDMTSTLITTMPIATNSLTKFTWAVPTTAKEPEAAMTFFEMMFNDSRLANLFAWGIEGVDYEVNESGVAGYIEGNENPSYHSVNFLNPNKLMVIPWTGESTDANSEAEKLMENAEYSSYLGFTADLSQLSNQISAINNIIEEYQPQVACGAADEDTYEEFNSKLESAGVNDIVAEYQKQLDEWVTQNE